MEEVEEDMGSGVFCLLSKTQHTAQPNFKGGWEVHISMSPERK